MLKEKEILENLKRCPSFERCSRNLCPLDYELHLRNGNIRSDGCKWMQGRHEKNIKGKQVVSGDSVMPDAILKYVPESNIEWLNEPSERRWQELRSIKFKND